MKFSKILAAAWLALGVAAAPAWAQTYPNKPIRMVVGFAPGGSTDVAARLIAKKVSEHLGQQVIVDSKPGAASNIAAQEVARAPADGYTLLYMTSTLAVNDSLYAKLPYNLVNDFVAVAPTVDIPCILSLHPSLPAKNMREFVALAKSKPGTISYGSAGNGSGTHLATELLKTAAGINLLHVPYKGSGPATSDFLGGHVQVLFVCQMSLVRDNAKSGKLVPLAVSSRARLPNLPDLPTVAETGFPGYEATVWNGVMAPAGTPRDIVAKLNAAITQSIKDLAPSLIETGNYPMSATPEQFGEFVKSEIGRWGAVVKRSGAKVE